MSDHFVVVQGSLENGFSLYGPFETEPDAEEFIRESGEGYPGPSVVMSMGDPADIRADWARDEAHFASRKAQP
jgi:hypothetical protein